MKNISKYLLGGVMFFMCFLSTKSYSQSRLPDGTIIYKDGSRQLPNGTVVYPNGTNRNNNGINRTIDGILHPNRNNTVYTNRYPRRNNGQWMPPGQAKKVYGGDARDYAPGHNKGRGNWNRRGDDNEDGEHGNGRGHGKGHGRDKDD
ncbi:MAG: hypothetical protein NVS3B19_03880 [Ginsengibacter sp.]